MKIKARKKLGKDLVLSKKEFEVLESVVVSIWQEYHFSRPPETPFEEKFGYSFEENDSLYRQFSELNQEKSEVIYIDFDRHMYDIFVTLLQEIINNFEYYEFETIAGFYKSEVEEVFAEMKKLEGEFD